MQQKGLMVPFVNVPTLERQKNKNTATRKIHYILFSKLFKILQTHMFNGFTDFEDC
jgi:hypothetical protein